MVFDHAIIEARLALDLILPEQMPELAWDALEAELDGPTIRRLAALEKPSGWEVDQIRAAFMAECGLKLVPLERAWTITAQQLARQILKEGSDPLSHGKSFEQMWIKANYPKQLEHLGHLDDDIYVGQYAGRSESEIRASVLGDLIELASAELDAGEPANACHAS